MEQWKRLLACLLHRIGLLGEDVTDIDMAWAAGFMDGEGTLSIRMNTRGYIHVRLSVVNTDPRPIYAFSGLFGGSVLKYNQNNPTQKPYYVWRCEGSKGSYAAKLMLPYLRVKREQAELVVQFLDTILPPSKKHHGMSEEQLTTKVTIMQKVQALNKKGPRQLVDAV